MRRLLATVVTAGVLLAGAGCSADREHAGGPTPAGSGTTAGADRTAPAGTAAPGGPAAPGGASATAGGNAAEVCAAATQAGSQAVTKFIAALAKLLQASGANDPKAATTARREAEAALDAWATAMRAQSARATDARLKTVLAEIGAEVGGMRADVESIDEATLDRLQQRLDTLCGR